MENINAQPAHHSLRSSNDPQQTQKPQQYEMLPDSGSNGVARMTPQQFPGIPGLQAAQKVYHSQQHVILPDSGPDGIVMPGMMMMGKKGPAVPPKPKKPSPSTVPPQVPKSSNVKKYCEPSYSTLLQGQTGPTGLDEHPYTNTQFGNAPGKMGLRKVTLDNALELQQQKEALEHHKRMMDIKMQRGQADGAVYENTPGRFYEGDSTYANIPGHRKNGEGLIYSNIVHNNNEKKPFTQRQISDELPPPPAQDLPVPLSLNELTLEDNDDEFPPPPSPVSSSYSELRRATDPPPMGRQPQPTYNIVGPGATGQTYSNLASNNQIYANNMHHQSLYGTYDMSSQGSTTYESIYEPINPRPTSQMSGRSNYSLYTPYVNSRGINSPNDSLITSASNQHHRNHGQKESEVDALTDLLVQSMDNVQDPDSFGTCVKCGDRVVGENTGCTAMDQIYHIACFTCQQCQINLQGKPFYALDGKPYCEEDYLNTLEKCSVCLKPILERILRATGKPYHPQCFTCIICGKSLDGIPFTVDATNQIHCIEDFHKKFAPRCCVCNMPIMPEPGQDETIRVVALDRSFHINCYKCEDCGLLLSSEAEGRGCYPLDDHILCKSCNAKRVQALTSHMTTEL
ncbi:lipoma-preferred partner homolog [Toxorhynchites rutilus septentrionalis]|uniref:lipoma-preferred partner homolog n=1 Tax=Toxorhynchites rutilus septentrionalis TaxID=329112 RepID=UPI002478706E|nr:lipoma-preferred partner homolog [Toxorhynchites rutilus septentrionalis]